MSITTKLNEILKMFEMPKFSQHPTSTHLALSFPLSCTITEGKLLSSMKNVGSLLTWELSVKERDS